MGLKLGSHLGPAIGRESGSGATEGEKRESGEETVVDQNANEVSELLSVESLKMLPTTRQDLLGKKLQHSADTVHLLGIDITHCAHWVQFCSLSLAIFVFYVSFGYMQELMFQLPGMKPFGWSLTLLQFVIYTVCGYTEGIIYHDTNRKLPMRIYALLAFFTVATMGLSNASVGYLNYPTQVIFKCCKLIPVLIGGIILQGKRYGWLDVTAAFLMSLGLALFTLADSHLSPVFSAKGYIMISGALFADAVIGNLQEKNMKKYGGSSNEMVVYSYSIGAVYIFILTVLSGEFFDAFEFFLEHPKETFGYGFIFGVLGYLGVNVVLTLIKAITITLSFILFSKPFTMDYLWAGLVILLALYMNLYAKNKHKWDPYMWMFAVRYLPCIPGPKKQDLLMV